MRAALVLAIIVISLPIAFCRPFYGTLLWAWAAYFRPQDLAWGLRGVQLSKWIAAVTLAGFFAAVIQRRQRVTTVFTRETNLMLFMLAVIAIVSHHALFRPDQAWGKFDLYWKMFLMTFLTVALVTNAHRLRLTVWTVAISLGALGFKAGFLGALRGARVQGPGGFIGDNNDFALALNMALPFLYYLTVSEKEQILKRIFGVTTFFTAVAVVLTHSRGGFLGMVGVAFLIACKSRYKAKAIAALFVVGVLGAAAVPIVAPEYFERIETISEVDSDGSIRGRLNAWVTCWNIAMDRPFTGVGPRNLQLPETFERYSPRPQDRHVAHNIYFQTLADGGFTLLIPFVLLWFFTWATLVRLRRRTPRLPENEWFVNYCHMIEVSLGAYAISGFFLSRSDFDLYFHIVGIAVAMKLIAPQVVVFESTEEPVEEVRPSLRPKFEDDSRRRVPVRSGG